MPSPTSTLLTHHSKVSKYTTPPDKSPLHNTIRSNKEPQHHQQQQQPTNPIPPKVLCKMYPAKTVQKTNAMLSKSAHKQGHRRSGSTTTVSTCNSCSQEIPSPLPSPSHHRHSSGSTTRRERHPPQMPPADDVKHDLHELIDEHIAWTQGASTSATRPRRESQGTMIVDWDGTGTPVISWRKRGGEDDSSMHNDNEDHLDETKVKEKRKSKPPPLSPLNVKPLPLRTAPSGPSSSHYTTDLARARNTPPSPLIPPPAHQPPFTARYHPPRYSPTTQTHHAPYVAGYDTTTHFDYDYDGRIVHVHRRGVQEEGEHDKDAARLSAHSDYYALDLDKYKRGVELRVAEGDGGDKKRKVRSSVGKFVEKVLFKLEGMGVLGRLREDRKKVTVAGKGKGKARDV